LCAYICVLQILYGRAPEENKENSAGHIIVISNSRDDDLRNLLIWRFPSVHAFSFEDSHNARTMLSIARSRGSTCGILDAGGHITPAFAASVDKIASTTVPVKIALKCGSSHEVHIAAIFAPRVCYLISSSKKEGAIWANVRSDGVATNFIVHLDIHSDYLERKYDDLLTIHINYNGTDHNHIKAPVLPISKGMTKYNELAADLVRIHVAKIAARMTTTMNYEKKDYEELLVEAEGLVKEVEVEFDEAAKAGLISGLEAEIQEIKTRLHNNYWWHDYMLPLSHNWWPLPPHRTQTQQVINLLLHAYSK
jgi:hypothetical protein